MLVTYQQIKNASRVCYFLIKSFQTDHIQLSQKHSVWATSGRNERSIVNAFENYDYVVLIFSVNASGKFYGYAVVTGLTAPDSATPVFVGSDGRTFPGRPFSVQWVSTLELPFKYFDHITNSFNDNKPVKVGRDGQLIGVEAGAQLLDVYEHVLEQQQHQQQVVTPTAAAASAHIAGGWMISSTEMVNPVDWEDHVLSLNPVLSIFPIDLTALSYQSYSELYQSSVEYLKSQQALPPPAINNYVDWSTPDHLPQLQALLATQSPV